MKASGQTEDQIDAFFVPRTASEKRKRLLDEAKEHADEFDQMKKDIDFLKEEVKLLRSAMGGAHMERKSEGSSTVDKA